MKRKTAHYVSECHTYRKVKADYMKPGGLLQPLSILNWRWEDINMDIIVGLPVTAHIILVHTNYNAERYIARILCLHGVLKMIIID
jgi:hypothetical protein